MLLSVYKSDGTNDPYAATVRRLMTAIPHSNRFTSELVKWEFLHGEHVDRAEKQRRRKWLAFSGITVRQKLSAGYLKTFDVLTVRPEARGGPVDGALAAYAVASKRDALGAFAIATADGDDFCWHAAIVVIDDFFRASECK